MEPSWHQSGVKHRCQLRKTFFHETHSRCSGGSFCRIKGVEVGSKNGPKIDEKMRSTREGILASIFISITAHLGAILAPFGPILGHLGSILAPSWHIWRYLPWVFLGRILAHLGSIFAHLGPSWSHLGSILVHLFAHLDRSWRHLGLILARLGQFWQCGQQ